MTMEIALFTLQCFTIAFATTVVVAFVFDVVWQR